MPYTEDSDNLPSNVKEMPEKKRRQWIHIFNSAISSGDDEATAFRKANGATKELMESSIKSYVESWQLSGRQLSPEEAGYNSVGMEDGRACANCRWFVSPDSCVLVYGDISPTGLSNYYKAYEPVMAMAVKSSSLKEKASSFFSRLFGQSPSIGSAVQGGNFSVKELDNETRFYLRVSNNFEDRESQTITLSAHKEYIEWVEAEKAYPELWVWHAAGSRLGQADLLDLSDGVLVASGVIDPDMVATAKAIEASGQFDGASHGFLHKSVGKDITKYRSYEISLVPRKFSSNLSGGGTLLTKEFEMAFSPEKRTLLVGVFGEDRVTQMEKETADLQKQFTDMGISSKEIDESVSLAESIEALTKTMTAGFQALNDSVMAASAKATANETALAELNVKVEAATKSLSEAVDDAVAPRVAASGVSAPSQSDDNVLDSRKDKDLVAATKSSDWMNDVVAKIAQGL